MFDNFELNENKKFPGWKSDWKNDSFSQKVYASLEQIGFHEFLHKNIIDILILLEKKSRFNEYSRSIECGMKNVLDFLEKRCAEKYLNLHFSKEQRIDAGMAAILHDIGKSGPVEATFEERKIIIKIFACENIRESDALLTEKIKEVFDENEVDEVLATLEKYNIGGKTTMRQFWDKHAQWTHDILEKYSQGINEHIRLIAGSHHIDREIDPYFLLKNNKEILPDTKTSGNMEKYLDALDGRALIALDQYEAAVERGKMSHNDALKQVQSNIVVHKNDKLMKIVLEAIDELGKVGKIFYA